MAAHFLIFKGTLQIQCAVEGAKYHYTRFICHILYCIDLALIVYSKNWMLSFPELLMTHSSPMH